MAKRTYATTVSHYAPYRVAHADMFRINSDKLREGLPSSVVTYINKVISRSKANVVLIGSDFCLDVTTGMNVVAGGRGARAVGLIGNVDTGGDYRAANFLVCLGNEFQLDDTVHPLAEWNVVMDYEDPGIPQEYSACTNVSARVAKGECVRLKQNANGHFQENVGSEPVGLVRLMYDLQELATSRGVIIPIVRYPLDNSNGNRGVTCSAAERRMYLDDHFENEQDILSESGFHSPLVLEVDRTNDATSLFPRRVCKSEYMAEKEESIAEVISKFFKRWI